MERQQLEKEYDIHVYEMGPDGKVSLHALFNYMQDAASVHAELLGYGRDDLMKNNHFWVLSRMYARLNDWPAWKDRIIVKTWPNGVDKLFAMRNYELISHDGRTIGSASSSWLIIDRTTKKIQRPDEFMHQYNRSRESFPSSVRNPEKLADIREVSSAAPSPSFRVKINDLDINLHTNNVNYIKWVTDTYDLNFVMHHRVCSAEINYLAEAIFGDEIIISTSAEDAVGSFFSHSVISPADKKEFCRVRLEWTGVNDR